ncbi:hypothetical protein NL108_013266, partial [Boleophthalmus pectinirostris]
SMASLYEDPQWSRSLDSYRSSLLTPHSVDSEKILSWLQDKAETPEFSLSDTWGALTSAAIMKTWDNRTLSEEAARNASNPYPVYGAVEQFCFNEGPTQGKWFELTPHEAGFSELELFVETSALGSKFQGGALLEDTPEMDMIQVQGTWTLYKHHAVVKYIVIIYDTWRSLYKVNRDESEQLRSLQQRGPQFLKWTYELGTTVQTWAYGLPEGPVKAQGSSLVDKIIPLVLRWEWGTVKNFLYKYDDWNQSGINLASVLFKSCFSPVLVLVLVLVQSWFSPPGSVLGSFCLCSMFLCCAEVPVPSCLASAELLHLMDGGLLVNTAYPSFLGPRRDIDLIIAPEYSAGEMFETLTLARAYAAEVGKPFPQLDDTVLEEEKLWPKDCYVFEGNDTAPTIVFMPLFNRRNCK